MAFQTRSRRNENGLLPEKHHKGAEHERELGFELKAAIARGKNGLNDLLDATLVYFTRQLQIDLAENFKDFGKIAEILAQMQWASFCQRRPVLRQ